VELGTIVIEVIAAVLDQRAAKIACLASVALFSLIASIDIDLKVEEV
jgi:hypothetical protein